MVGQVFVSHLDTCEEVTVGVIIASIDYLGWIGDFNLNYFARFVVFDSSHFGYRYADFGSGFGFDFGFVIDYFDSKHYDFDYPCFAFVSVNFGHHAIDFDYVSYRCSTTSW